MDAKNYGGAHSAPSELPVVPRRHTKKKAKPLPRVPSCTVQHDKGIWWRCWCALDDVEYGLSIGRKEPRCCVLCGRNLVDAEVRR